VSFTAEEISRFAKRLRRNPLYRGPCLILERQTGRALDATYEPKVSTQPVLWTMHGLPWQRWYLNPVGRGPVPITCEKGGLALGTKGSPGDWSEVSLQTPTGVVGQQWRLHPTDDGAAFLVESAISAHALDATDSPEDGTHPHLWSSHWAAWQQWVVARLPLS
jgi:hypothetical protein